MLANNISDKTVYNFIRYHDLGKQLFILLKTRNSRYPRSYLVMPTSVRFELDNNTVIDIIQVLKNALKRELRQLKFYQLTMCENNIASYEKLIELNYNMLRYLSLVHNANTCVNIFDTLKCVENTTDILSDTQQIPFCKDNEIFIKNYTRKPKRTLLENNGSLN